MSKTSGQRRVYFEFGEQEYYAIVTVSVSTTDLYTMPHKIAIDLYKEVMGQESFAELDSPQPRPVTKEYALCKLLYSYADTYKGMTLKTFVERMERAENCVLLVNV